ncbi:uncharacterized protein LOC135695529 isoform X2 [Rhopilema esculentum]|uniref:uncharacterized protein LOC135695529 isoform X2 n=1 Tax=Rhopilema esculentum TaxID=499914 RepID=UPI0031CF9967
MLARPRARTCGFDGSGGNEGMSETSFEPFSPTNKGERIVINVGGTRHETYIGTLHSVPDTRLYWITEKHTMSPEYDPDRQEYFFDRHPGLFSYILDYYRTGKLHCPADVCGPLFEEELLFWGIDEAVIEPCCWMNYQKHRDAEVNLQSFDSLDGDDERNSVQPSDVENQGQLGEQDSRHLERRSTLNSIMRKWTYWQPKVWSTLEEPNSSKAAQVIGLISMSLIAISVTTFCLETLEFFKNKGSIQYQFLEYLEIICVTWFTLEFVSRLIFSADKVAFFKSLMNWIDFCAIFPFFLELMLRKNNMRTIVVLRVVRITRLFRIFKLSRHSYGLQILGHTLKSSCRELFLLVFFLSIAVVIFSSLIYYAEKDRQADKFDSIPGSFWWSVVTMTTIGYGDIVPKTAPGKCVGIMCALCGVLVIALPIPVIVNNFSLYYSHAQARLRVSNKRKKPLLFGAANALRMTDPWMPNRLLQKQRSEQSDFTAILHSPRRTPLASPTPTIRQFAAISGANAVWNRGKEIGFKQAISRASPCPSINSSLNSRASVKTPPSSRRVSNHLTEENGASKHSSPTRGLPSQLPVIRLSPNYESPSINVSPPSTPSRTNSQIQSSVGSPFPLSPCAESSTFSQDLYTPKSSTCPSRQDLSPLQSPLFLCSPDKSTLSTCISDIMTTPSTPCSFSSSSSKLASPRGRMGRRNGICILGYQSRGPPRRKASTATRTRKTSTRSFLDSSDSQMSSRRDSRVFSNMSVAESRDERSCLVAPSPGVSKTLFEVSRRLETMMPEESPPERSPKPAARTTSVSNDSVRSAYSSRSSSPLVRQKATNATLESMSSQETDQPSEQHDGNEENVPKLESVMNGLIFKRRNRQKQEKGVEGFSCTVTPMSASLAGSGEAISGAPSIDVNEIKDSLKQKSSQDQMSFKSLEVFDRSSPNLTLQPINDNKNLKTKSLDDIRTNRKEKSESEGRNVISVSTSPSSPGLGKFQYTITCRKEAFVESRNASAEEREYQQGKEVIRPAVCFSGRRCKSADNNRQELQISEDIRHRAQSNDVELTISQQKSAPHLLSKSIDLVSKSFDKSPLVPRRYGFSARSPWASRLGHVHDSGVHSMSMSQNQETCTLDLQLDELPEGGYNDKEANNEKVHTTVQ